MGLIFSKRSATGMIRNFRSLGNMRGMPISQIQAKCGPWHSRSALPAGQTLYQWMAHSAGGSYHIALVAGPDNKVVKITHEGR